MATEYPDLTALNAACPLEVIDVNGTLGAINAQVPLQALLNALGSSTLTDNGDGTWTHNSGVIGSPDETFMAGWTTITNNDDGTITFTYPDSSTVIIDICDVLQYCSVDAFGDVDTTTNAPAVGNALVWDGANWVPAGAGLATYFENESPTTFDPNALPLAPLNPPATANAGDTLVEHFANGDIYWTYDGANWIVDFDHTHCCEAVAVAGIPYDVALGVTLVQAEGGSAITLPDPPPDPCCPITVCRDACTTGDVTVVDGSGGMIGGVHPVFTLKDGRCCYEFLHNGSEYVVAASYCEDDPSTAFFEVTNETNLQLEIVTTGADFTVDWGDGTVETFASGATVNHAYGAPFTGQVSITVLCGLSQVTEFTDLTGNWSFDVSAITQFPSLANFEVGTGNTVSGDIAAAFAGAPNLFRFVAAGLNTISGSLVTAFANTPLLENVQITGLNAVTGDLFAALSNTPLLTIYATTGNNTTSGDIELAFSQVPNLGLWVNSGSNTTFGDVELAFASTPNLTIFSNQGNNTTSGDTVAAFANTPNLTNYENSGTNTTFGDVTAAFASTPNLVNFTLHGNSVLSGDIATAFALAPALERFAVTGMNALTGVLETAWASTPSLDFFSVAGMNTVSGNIAAAFALTPLLVFFNASTNNTITGDITAAVAATPNLVEFSFNGNQTVTVSAPINLGASFTNFFSLQAAVPWTSGEIDDILIGAAATAAWTAPATIDIAGVHAPRTVASDAAVLTLTGNGVTVITN